MTAVAFVALLAGCGQEDPDGGAVPPPSLVAPSTTAQAVVLDVVGGPMYATGAALVVDLLGESLAGFERGTAALGYGPVRIAWKDGEYLAITEDLMIGRVNVAVVTDGDDRIVVDAFVENDPESGSATAEATIVDVFEGVEFYPACGNETLSHQGVVWHQVNEADYPEIHDRAVNGFRENPPGSVRGFAPRVAEPGPGDDIGTLVVWSDGVAYFASDSGDLTAWLVTDELAYDWVC